MFYSRLASGPTGPEIELNFEGAVFGPTAGPGSPLSLVVQAGQDAPGTGGALFRDFGLYGDGLNDRGDQVFMALLATGPTGAEVTAENDWGIFTFSAERAEPVSLLLREGDPARGIDGAVYRFLSTPANNNSGGIAFAATISYPDLTTERVIYGPVSGSASAFDLIVREGQVAPGTGGAIFANLYDPSLNDRGDIAFLAELGSGLTGESVDDTNDLVLYAVINGEPKLILREGQELSVLMADGSTATKTILETNPFALGASIDLAQRSLSNNGVLAFNVTFSDGSKAIYSVVVPDPATGAILGAGLVALGRCRRAV